MGCVRQTNKQTEADRLRTETNRDRVFRMSTKKYMQKKKKKKRRRKDICPAVTLWVTANPSEKKKKKKHSSTNKQKNKDMYPHQPSGPAKESKEGIIALPLT